MVRKVIKEFQGIRDINRKKSRRTFIIALLINEIITQLLHDYLRVRLLNFRGEGSNASNKIGLEITKNR
jgi:hypothetical protein